MNTNIHNHTHTRTHTHAHTHTHKHVHSLPQQNNAETAPHIVSELLELTKQVMYFLFIVVEM